MNRFLGYVPVACCMGYLVKPDVVGCAVRTRHGIGVGIGAHGAPYEFRPLHLGNLGTDA